MNLVSSRRKWLLGAGLILLAMTVASCGAIRAISDLKSSLDSAGISTSTVKFDTTNDKTTVVVVGNGPSSEDNQAASDDTAKIIWTEFPRQVDYADVTMGGARQVYSRADMVAKWGNRPAGLDDKKVGDDLKHGFFVTLLIGGFGLFMCLGLILFIVLLVSRSRKSRRETERRGPFPVVPPGTTPPESPIATPTPPMPSAPTPTPPEPAGEDADEG